MVIKRASANLLEIQIKQGLTHIVSPDRIRKNTESPDKLGRVVLQAILEDWLEHRLEEMEYEAI